MSDKESGNDELDLSTMSLDRRRVLQLAGAGAFGSTTLVSEAIAANGNLNVDVRQIVARTDPKFPTVKVYASVTDSNNNPVTGLSSSAFSVAEDGTTQSIESLVAPESSNTSDVSVSIVIDRSGSMAGTKISDARAAAKDFVQQFQVEDEGQIIAFHDTIEFKERWSKDESELTGAIDTISAGGGTNLWGATKRGVEQAAPRVGRSAVVVLTDGKNTKSTTLNEAITAAQESNVPVYTIGLGSDADESDLQTLANDTGGTYHFAPDSSDLATIYDRISQSIADEYEITYETTNTATDGTIRDVTVTANYNGDSGSDTGTYEAPCAPLPTARFDSPPTSAVVGQPVSFDGSPSTPNGGSLVAYMWDFDNNGVTDATGEQATHTYTSAGTYEARLTVEKMCGARDVAVTEEFTVTQGNYDLSITSVNDPINAGETLEVEATVTNISNETKTDVVSLYDFDGNQITPAASIHLGAGESTDVSLTWNTQTSDSGTDEITVKVGQVSVTETVTIEESEAGGEVQITNPRLVQTVENTRIGNSETADDSEIGDAPNDIEATDPDLVEGRKTAVVFDLESNQELTFESNVEVTVTEDSTGSPQTHTTELHGEVLNEVVSGSSLLDEFARRPLSFADGPDDVIVDRFESPYPTFDATTSLSSVELSVNPKDSAIERKSVSLSSADFSVTDMPTLDIGFTVVHDKNNERDYGTVAEEQYQQKVKEWVRYAQRVAPTSQVNWYRKPHAEGLQAGAIPGPPEYVPGSASAEIAAISADMTAAQLSIDQSFVTGLDTDQIGSVTDGFVNENDNPDINGFDVTIAVVPDDYFAVVRDKPDTTGLHINSPLGTGMLQPRIAAMATIDAREDTVIHEAGHHFLGEPFDGQLAKDEGDGQGPMHMQGDIVSTKFNTELDFSSSFIERNTPSYMSYEPDPWADAVTTRLLMEDDGPFKPTPPHNPVNKHPDASTFSAVGQIKSDGFEFSILQETNAKVRTTGADSGVAVQVKDADGSTITEQTVPTKAKAVARNGETTVVDGVIIGHIAYPEETSEVEFTADDPEGSGQVSTTINDDDIQKPAGPEPELPADIARFDTDNDGNIEVGEVLDAISAYNEGEPIGGEQVSIREVLDLISAYTTN
ncbi:VWA domain-containing protein [Halorhabdus sp. CBA1104]|uniref:VWA domain-containing protein n=1 Tax=Halorhabdus sp. CBA1104 TaxID=1380432 RepID=UPI0018A6D04C|nr:VWA domain-containing protein [Halorhabdus sp. CBA1104]